MNTWTDSAAPRIWRCPDSDFTGDEPLHASGIYTPQVFKDIHSHGFNGVWLRGRLYELMRSTMLPELNDPQRDQRIESLRQTIQHARQNNMGVYLFFNEPLALPDDHPVWDAHPELAEARSQESHDFSRSSVKRALCTSLPFVQQFFREAVESLLADLPELAGVILITASEHFSHCWSHIYRRSLDDGVEREDVKKPSCPRCVQRDPADVVLDLLRTWRDAAREHAPRCRVLAWNWSWSMWHADPQPEIIGRLPEGVELLVDWERGGLLTRANEKIVIDEYSLSYPGPSERFLTSQAAAPAGTPVHAKLQIGTTHEVATVPNLPLIHSLHAKLAGLSRHGVAGTMACWNFGCGLTLNSYAVKHYLCAPERYKDLNTFTHELAQNYFGLEDAADLNKAWQSFGQAFAEHYPFSITFVYWSPVNDAPAHPLSLEYQAKRLGPTWKDHEFGDDPTNCLGQFTVDDVARRFTRLAEGWQAGLRHYERALAETSPEAPPAESPDQRKHREQELSCARMIGIQMESTANFFRFHQRRLELVPDASQPCTLPPDETLLAIMEAEIDNANAALPLVESDARLGMHQECHVRMYEPGLIREKIRAMQAELERAKARS